jgi:small-conductance mechanosensitive channel
MDDLTDLLSVSANEFWEAVGSFLPSLVGAILLILLGALVAKLAEKLVRKVFELISVDKLQKNKAVKKTLDDNELNIDITNLAGRITFWVVIIIFALAATEVLGLNAMRDTIRDLLAYLPSVLAAVVVITVTIAGARLLRDAILAGLRRMSVDYAKPIANISYYVLLVFGVLMALSQLGFDTTIIANNVTIIVAGVVLALALAFGLGGREVAGRIVEQMYDNTSSKKRK